MPDPASSTGGGFPICGPGPADPTKVVCTEPKPKPAGGGPICQLCQKGWEGSRPYRLAFNLAASGFLRFLSVQADETFGSVGNIPGLEGGTENLVGRWFGRELTAGLASGFYQATDQRLDPKQSLLLNGAAALGALGLGITGASTDSHALKYAAISVGTDVAVSATERAVGGQAPFDLVQMLAGGAAFALTIIAGCGINPHSDRVSDNDIAVPVDPADHYGNAPSPFHDRRSGAQLCMDVQGLALQQGMAGLAKLVTRGIVWGGARTYDKLCGKK